MTSHEEIDDPYEIVWRQSVSCGDYKPGHYKCYAYHNLKQIDLTPISSETKIVSLPEGRKIVYGICHNITQNDQIPDGCYEIGACIYQDDKVIATLGQAKLKPTENGVDLEFLGSYEERGSVKVQVGLYYDHIGFESEPRFLSSGGSDMGYPTTYEISQKTKHAQPLEIHQKTNCIFDMSSHGIDVNLATLAKS